MSPAPRALLSIAEPKPCLKWAGGKSKLMPDSSLT